MKKKKDWDAVACRVCLAFPDLYEIGMSHLGYKILYGILNQHPKLLAERAYAVWPDMEAKLREHEQPLLSLESARPLSDFDVVGFSLQFELTYTSILQMLDLGGIPRWAADRGEDDPLVVAGGPVATHGEPLAPFVDVFLIGDGEAKTPELALTWAALRDAGVPRAERLVALAKLGGLYVPSLYTTRENPETGLPRRRARASGRALPRRAYVPPRPRRVPLPGRRPRGGDGDDLRSRVGGGRPRVHRGVPLLPGGDDLPAGPREGSPTDYRHDPRGCGGGRLRRSLAHVIVDRGLQRDRAAGARDDEGARREACER